MSGIRVRTPSRLHFGLFGWGPHARRQFGGVGLMTTAPGLEVVVERSDRMEASGPSSDRALGVAASVSARLADTGHGLGPVRVTCVRVPPPHIGLGVGTQLSLAVARGLTELAGLRGTPVEALARLTGRGRRSGIGVHGFAEGGLIVDGGRRAAGDVPARLVRSEFPATWSVLLATPEQDSGLSGQAEQTAFRNLPPIPESQTDRLCGLVLLGLLPAVIERDLAGFGRALTEIQDTVGDLFAPAQGGRFATPEASTLVRHLRDLGLHGVGQSSWGPTVYGFSDATEGVRAGVENDLGQKFPSQFRLVWTKADNRGSVSAPF